MQKAGRTVTPTPTTTETEKVLPGATVVKYLARRSMRHIDAAPSMGWEDPLEGRVSAWTHEYFTENSPTEEPGRPQSIGSKRVGQDWSDLAGTHRIRKRAGTRFFHSPREKSVGKYLGLVNQMLCTFRSRRMGFWRLQIGIQSSFSDYNT